MRTSPQNAVLGGSPKSVARRLRIDVLTPILCRFQSELGLPEIDIAKLGLSTVVKQDLEDEEPEDTIDSKISEMMQVARAVEKRNTMTKGEIRNMADEVQRSICALEIVISVMERAFRTLKPGSSLRTRYVLWHLVAEIKRHYAVTERDYMMRCNAKPDPALLKTLRVFAGLAYRFMEPTPRGNRVAQSLHSAFTYFSSSFTIALAMYFVIPLALSDYLSNDLHPGRFWTTIAVTGALCLGFTILTAISRAIRFEQPAYWFGRPEKKRVLDADYNIGRRRIQRALRAGATALSWEVMPRSPQQVAKNTRDALSGMKSIGFGLSSSAIGVLVLEFQPIGEGAFEAEVPAELESIKLVARVYAFLLLLVFVLSTTAAILMNETEKLVPSSGPRVKGAVGVFEDVLPYLNIAGAANSLSAVCFATCAHIIALISYRVERVSSTVITAAILLVFYVFTSNVAYTKADILINEIDFDEGPLSAEFVDESPKDEFEVLAGDVEAGLS